MKHWRLLAAAVLTTAPLARASAQENVLPAGTALSVELDSATRLRLGAKVFGHLTAPIYLVSSRVVPAGTLVTGHIQALHPGSHAEHVQRLLAADFTPPRVPEVVFETLALPSEQGGPPTILPISARGEVTTAGVLTMGTQQHRQSLGQRLHTMIGEDKQALRERLKRPRVKETVEKWAIGQLPYHPDILWSKTRFNADLSAPAALPGESRAEVPVADLHGPLPEGTLTARLLTPLSSATAKYGDPVEASVVEPLFSRDHSELLVPAGTRMMGRVLQSRPARRLGRNGSLRFTFTKLDLPGTTEGQGLKIHGQLSAAETNPDVHASLDEEGQVRATDGPGKLAQPAVLLVLAAAATPDDHDTGGVNVGNATVTSNGFGLIARVVSLATRNRQVVQGFAYYALAKSLYYRVVSKGHEMAFDHNTEMHVTLAGR